MIVDFDKLFVEGLNTRGVAFVASGDGTYKVHVKGRELTLNTQNIRAEVLRDKQPEEIGRFLDHALAAVPELPAWSQASQHLFPMIESIAVDLGPDTVSTDLSDRAKVVLALYRPGASSVRLVAQSDLLAWGVSPEEAWSAAHTAFKAVVADTKVEVLRAGNLALGAVHAFEPYKASVILSPSLRSRIPEELGWPILAVAPARDFVYLLRRDDRDALARVGAVVVREFRESGYPVSTEIWELSDDGVEAIGEFPVE